MEKEMEKEQIRQAATRASHEENRHKPKNNHKDQEYPIQ